MELSKGSPGGAMGRPRRFRERSFPCTLSLPRAVLDELDRLPGSRTDALLSIISSDKAIRSLRRVIQESLKNEDT